MAILEHFWEILSKRQIHLVVCGIEDELKRVMTGSGLRNQIGEQNIFYADNKLFQSTELALARAMSIVEMEKLKTEAEVGVASIAPQDRPIALDILSPRLLRFGHQHALREAVWLTSEMLKRSDSKTAIPLFLQDREGKLDGELTVWAMLVALSDDLSPGVAEYLSPEDLGEVMRRQFDTSISEVCRRDLPKLGEHTEIHQLVQSSVNESLIVLPICDEDGRLKGLVRSIDLLKGIGMSIGFKAEQELPKV